MSVAFACRAQDSLAIGYPFRGAWHPAFDARDIGTVPVDGTFICRDRPVVAELDADPGHA